MYPAQSTPTFQMNVIMGKLVGVCQDEDGRFFARIATKHCEIKIPILAEQFHQLKLGGDVKIEVEFET